MMSDTPGISADLVRDLVRQERRPQRDMKADCFRCPSCKEIFQATILDQDAYFCLICGHKDRYWSDYRIIQGVDMEAMYRAAATEAPASKQAAEVSKGDDDECILALLRLGDTYSHPY